MNYKNYKLEALELINKYKELMTKDDVIIPKSMNDMEDAIKLLNDENCLNTEFLDDIWIDYCKKDIPYGLLINLFDYTSFKNQTICWKICTNPDIVMIDTKKYKICLPSEKTKDIIKTKDDIFYDVLEIPVIFDYNSKQWYISEDAIYGLINTYSPETAKKLCKIQDKIIQEINKAKEIAKKIAEENKRKEKERIKEEKRKAKELEKELKRQERIKKLLTEGTEKQKASNKKKALKQLKVDAIQTQLKF